MANRTKRKRGASEAAPADVEKTAAADRRVVIGVGFALAAIVLAIYVQVLDHRFINLDDADYLDSNAYVAAGLNGNSLRWAWKSTLGGMWLPLTWVSYMIDVELFGLVPGRIIFMNALWHAANAILLFVVLTALTNATWPSAAVAALFAAHPLRVESVAWATERKDVLSTFFFLLMLFFYARYVRRKSTGAYWLTVAAFAASLMAKPMMVTAPFVLLLLDVWPLRRRFSAGLVLEKTPHFIILAIISSITLQAQQASMYRIPLVDRVGNAVLSYVAYLRKTFWPADLAAIYGYRLDPPALQVAGAALLLIAVTAVAVAAWKRAPWLLIGWLWFLGTLVPVIGLVQVGRQGMADRFMYVPQIGLLIALVWIIVRLVPAVPAAVLGAIVTIALAITSFAQVRHWQNGVVLFEHAVRATGGVPIAYNHLAWELLRSGDPERAVREFENAIRRDPEDSMFRAGLGVALLESGKTGRARAELDYALKLSPNNVLALRARGNAALGEGDPAAALDFYERAQRLAPDPAIAAAIASIGTPRRTLEWHREEARRNPGDPDVRNALAMALSEAGRDQDALVEYEAALRMAPRHYDANLNLGTLLSQMNRSADAVERFQAAANARPDLTEPLVYMALVQSQMNRFGDAIAAAERAITMNERAANEQFTRATRMPARETNLREWVGFLRSQPAAR